MKKLIISLWLVAAAALGGQYYVYFASDYGTPSQDTLTNVLGRLGTNNWTYLVIDGGDWTITNGQVVVPENVELIVKRGSEIIENGGTLTVHTIYKDVRHFKELFVDDSLTVSGSLKAATIEGDGAAISNVPVSSTMSNVFVIRNEPEITADLKANTHALNQVSWVGLSSNKAIDFVNWRVTYTGTLNGLSADEIDGHNSDYFYPASNPSNWMSSDGILQKTTSAAVVEFPFVGGENAGVVYWHDVSLQPFSTGSYTLAIGPDTNDLFNLPSVYLGTQLVARYYVGGDGKWYSVGPYEIGSDQFMFSSSNCVNDGDRSVIFASENSTNHGTRCVMFSAAQGSTADGCDSFILGGADNHITTNAHESAIIASGGSRIERGFGSMAFHSGIIASDHSLISESYYSGILGGQQNKIMSSYPANVILGGRENQIIYEALRCAILGGYQNSIYRAWDSVIFGRQNTIQDLGGGVVYYGYAFGYNSAVTSSDSVAWFAFSHGDYSFSIGKESYPFSLWINDQKVWDNNSGPTNGIWWLVGSVVPTSSTAAAQEYTIVPDGTNVYLCYTNSWLGSGTNWIVIHGELF